jgi:hypothetical protein
MSSMRVNPTSALTLRNRSTASTRVIACGRSGAALLLRQREAARRVLLVRPDRVLLQVLPFGDKQIDRIPLADPLLLLLGG